ncbi:hypothetical protein LCGC14_2145060 [marine sediment metagenome]|uniref:Uncharacterized protein n=1 Tax=marine sediment metagenome TaxID=412755 RepID=A0A0F9EJI7_9ZZZZ
MSDVAGLVVRVRDGDAEAFGDLVARFADMAYGYAYAILKDFHQAEDAAQEAFVEAFVNLGKLRDPAAFAGWLRRIVAGRCRRIVRGRKPAASLEAAGEAEAPGESPAEAAQRREIKETVLAAIGALPEDQRTATSLFYINGYSQKDIAEFLEVRVSTVKNRLHAARGRLRERMLKMVPDAFEEHKLPEEFPQRTLEQAFIARDVDQLLLAVLPSLGKLRRIPKRMCPKGAERLFEWIKAKDSWPEVFKEGMTLSEMVLLVGLIPHKGKLLAAALELLDKHPNIARAAGAESGMTPLHLALAAPLEGEEHELQLKLVQKLLELGADPAGRSVTSATPLHYAAGMGNVEAATQLLDAGAELDAQKQQKATKCNTSGENRANQ